MATVHSIERQINIPSERLTRAEHLFAELDGYDIRSGTSRWLACVLGIHTERDETWVQLSLVGPSPCSVVVHLLPRTTARDAIDAITSWLASPDRPRIVQVG
jgi:hypothetical protein